MNVEKVKKFSVENAGRIANAVFDLAVGVYCLGMASACIKAGYEDPSVGVLIVTGLTMSAKAGVETGALSEAYLEFSE